MRIKKTTGRWFAGGLLIIAILLSFCEDPIFSDEYEPNDSIEDAKLISLNETVSARIFPDSDVDFFRVTFSADSDLSYTLNVPDEIRPEIRFYNASGEEMIEHRNHSSELGATLEDSFPVTAGDVVVRVSSFSYEESQATYSLIVRTSVPVIARYD